MLKFPPSLPQLLAGEVVDASDYEGTSLHAWAGKKDLSPLYLKELSMEECYRNLLRELAPILKKNKVHPLVLGGVSFWDDFYEAGTRRVYDLDIWIAEEEFDSCATALIEAGFKQHEKYKCTWLRHALEIDLHTHPINSDRGEAFDHLFKFSAKEIYERGEFLPVCPEEPWRRPSGEDLWVQHALHAVKHEFERLNLVLDLHFLLKRHRPESELGKKLWRAVSPVLEKLNCEAVVSPEKPSAMAHKILLPENKRPFLAGLRLMASMGESPVKFFWSLAVGNKAVHRESGGVFKRYKRILEKI